MRFSLLKLAICAKPPPKGTPPAPPKGIPPARNTFGPLWGYFGSLWVHFGGTLRSYPVPCELKPVPYELKVSKVLAFLREYKENHKSARVRSGAIESPGASFLSTAPTASVRALPVMSLLASLRP